MFQLERLDKILTFVNEHKKANTAELSELFDVSPVTIRRDIEKLSADGLLIKTHGGAMASESTNLHDIPFASRLVQNLSAKKAIARAAAALIRDGDTIILDSGSTTLEIARNITQQQITVVTNDIRIAIELFSKPNITVRVPGGTLQDTVYVLIDGNTNRYFSMLHVNKTFLSCDAVDSAFGVSNRSYEQGLIKQRLIAAADEVILTADSSKFNKKAFSIICGLDEINTLVTNRIPADIQQECSRHGVHVINTDTPEDGDAKALEDMTSP